VSLQVAKWLFDYRREWLPADLTAGLTTAAIVIPKAMAYALIAGLTVEAGLYTALAAMLVYPLLGSSRPLSVSTTSALAMLTAASVVAISSHATGASAAAVAATLALMVGGVLIVARLLRLGFLANFISLPVLVGFETGVGIVIIIGQLKSVLGVHVESTTTVGTLLEVPALLPQAHGPTMLVAAIGIMMLVVLERRFPHRPVPLLLVALSIAASFLFDLDALGVKTVGAFPAGLPTLAMPDLGLSAALWPAALGVALMSFTESVAAARTFWQHDDPPVGANQELLAVGAANVAAAAVGGLPAGGGTSQTSVAEHAGARSQLAQWVTAGAVLITLLVLSSAIGALPEAALGAVIVVAAFGMIKPAAFRAISRVRRTEFLWALATVAGVVLIGTLEGILIAVAISMLTLIYQANHPPVYAVAYNREQRIFRRVGENPADETFPGLLILRTEGRLTFANAANAGEKMQALVAQSQPRVIVLECSGIPDIEYTALVTLADAEQRLRTHGVTLWLAAVNPDLLPALSRSPLTAASDPSRRFANLHKALEAWQHECASSRPQRPSASISAGGQESGQPP
jgi:high affinity sulfate transporter 1